MFLIRNFLKSAISVKVSTGNIHVRHVRTAKSSIKIGKEKFQLTLNLQQFNKDEIVVKAHPEYLIIEGKQEKQVADGNIVIQFVRKYRLPEGCVIKKMESTFSSEGILRVTAPRENSSPDAVDITLVPIKPEFKTKEKLSETKNVQSKAIDNPCDTYPKVKPMK